MNLPEREKIINYFSGLERKGAVYHWRIHDIDIWPIVKTTIFLSLFYQRNQPEDESKNRAPKKVSKWYNLLALLNAYWEQFWLMKRRPDVIFSGAHSHRVILDGLSFNRYFDPLIDLLEDQNKSGLMLQYDKEVNINHYRSRRVYHLDTILPIYRRAAKHFSDWNTISQLEGFEQFLLYKT